MKSLGLDIGCRHTKACDGANIMSFPTTVTRVTDKDNINVKTCITIDDEKFYAGNDAKGAFPWYDTRTVDFIGSLPWVAVLGKAIKDCRFDTFRNILVFGVPAAWYSRVKAVNLVSQLKRKTIIVGNEHRIDLNNLNIGIVPHGYGIFWKYIMDSKTDYKRFRISVTDIGYHTIDFITIHQGNYLNNQSKSYPFGISSLLDMISGEFFEKYKFFISRNRALDFIAYGRVEMFEQLYEIDNIEDVINKYSKEVNMIINNYVENENPDIFISGGGGMYILSRFIKLRKRLAIVNSPEYANAIGHWHYGTL
ncbi:MAG TPA: ParM/StbA family protein [Syntrophales bacterium]|nr:ParM/StbA family protein [Syntrophales bacterium]